MLKMVDGTGIIGVDMICPLGISTPQPPNYDKVELEGAGMLALPNSLDAPLERLELGGKTEQAQTTGAQLITLANRTDVGDTELGGKKWLTKISEQAYSVYNNYQKSTVEFMGNNSFKLSHNTGASSTNGNGLELPVKIKPDTDYTLSYTSSISEVLVYFIQMDSGCNKLKETSSRNKNHTFHSEANAEWVILKFASVLNNSYVVSNIQFEKGTVATSFEPYTGGKPSPSPEYPQEIKNVGKWNEETQKYEIEISISGRNLFDFSTCEEGKIFEGSGNIVSAANSLLTDFIPCFPNSQYSRSRTGSTVVAFYDCDKNKIGFEIVGNTTFVTPEKCRYFRFSAVKTVVDYTKIVACPGQTVMDYEPYREPKFFTITSDRPITKWDRLVEQGGQIGWLYQSAINEYRGDASVAIYQNGFYFLLNNKKLKSGEGYCEELKQYVSREEKPYINFNMSPNTYAYTLNTQAIYGSTTSAIKEYLKTHPLHLVYKTETTEFVPLPQSEQNAIRALKTYYPTTVITADGGELAPDIKATYRKEI